MRSLLKWVVKQLEKLMAKKPVVFGSPDGSQFVDDDDIPAGARIIAVCFYDATTNQMVANSGFDPVVLRPQTGICQFNLATPYAGNVAAFVQNMGAIAINMRVAPGSTPFQVDSNTVAGFPVDTFFYFMVIGF